MADPLTASPIKPPGDGSYWDDAILSDDRSTGMIASSGSEEGRLTEPRPPRRRGHRWPWRAAQAPRNWNLFGTFLRWIGAI